LQALPSRQLQEAASIYFTSALLHSSMKTTSKLDRRYLETLKRQDFDTGNEAAIDDGLSSVTVSPIPRTRTISPKAALLLPQTTHHTIQTQQPWQVEPSSVESGLWQDLPVDILVNLFVMLEQSEIAWPDRSALLAMAGVCRSWRRIVLEQLGKIPWAKDNAADFAFPCRLLSPPPGTVKCYVRRERSCSGGWYKNKHCQYNLYLGTDYDFGGHKLLLSATKVTSMWNSKLVISIHPDISSAKDLGCLGVLSSNIIGTKFRMKYRSQKPSDAIPSLSLGETSKGSISYKCNVLGMQGPRRLAVTMDNASPIGCESGVCPAPPQVNWKPRSHSQHPTFTSLETLMHGNDKQRSPSSPSTSRDESSPISPVTFSPPTSPGGHSDTDSSPSSPSSTLASPSKSTSKLKRGKHNSMYLRNKAPRWHEELQCWCLDFQGRVTQASVKNFQLVHPDTDEVVLQFGKVGKNLFTMDFKQPFSVVQAFSICLSAFEFKLACE